MFQNIVSYLQFGQHFCGVEHATINNEDTILITLLKKAKNKIELEQNFEASSIEIASSFLPKKQHLILIINNNSVLSKSITSDINDPLKLVYKVFPNINTNEFYYEVLTQGKTHFISICRKDDVDKIIEGYKKLNKAVLSFSLGNTIVSNVAAFIPSPSIATSNSKITIQNNYISTIEKSAPKTINKYNINGLEATSKTLNALAGALQPILQTNTAHTNYNTLKQSLFKDYKESRFFSQFFKFGLFFVLSLLLINFFFFNHYFEKVKTLQQTSQINEANKSTILKLNEDVTKTKKLVDDVLKSNASKSSFYTNAIVQSLPNTILLDALNFQPLLKRVKEDQAIQYNEKSIFVSGASTSSKVFSEWIALLEAKNWIETIDIKDYGDTSKAQSIFTIKLNLTND